MSGGGKGVGERKGCGGGDGLAMARSERDGELGWGYCIS